MATDTYSRKARIGAEEHGTAAPLGACRQRYAGVTGRPSSPSPIWEEPWIFSFVYDADALLDVPLPCLLSLYSPMAPLAHDPASGWSFGGTQECLPGTSKHQGTFSDALAAVR